MKLSELKNEEKGIVTKINMTGIEKRRVLDLGIVRGETVKVIFDGPFGEPKAIEVVGTLISLRKEERDKIEVKKIV